MAINPAELQGELPPGVRVVDAIEAPGGGIWALGSDGGVFSVRGAPFFGSYMGLAPEARQGERSFVRIQRNDSGGYSLISQRGEVYNFAGSGGPGAVPPPAPAPPAAPPPVPEGAGAKATIEATLKQFGLNFLPGTADTLFRSFISGGKDQFMLDLRQTPEYKSRFPAMEALRSQGRALDEASYLSYEKTAVGLFRQFGLPSGFYDQPEDFTAFIAGEVSPAELADRVQSASVAAFSSPPEVREELQRLYGVTPGELTAVFLDPNRALPVIQRQVLAAELGGASRRTGFGLLTAEEAERLASVGVTAQEAQAGFSSLAGTQELFGTLPGEAGEQITREEQLGATFEGSAGAQERIRRRQARRKAGFEGGGGFAAGQGGVSGLGGG